MDMAYDIRLFNLPKFDIFEISTNGKWDAQY